MLFRSDGASNPGYLTLAKRNNDVDVKAIIAIIDHMMGKDPESFSKKAVDMNGDTFYNIADIIQIVNQILSTQ